MENRALTLFNSLHSSQNDLAVLLEEPKKVTLADNSTINRILSINVFEFSLGSLFK